MPNPWLLSFQHKVLLALLLLINLPFWLAAYGGRALVEDALLEEKQGKLLALTRVLDSMLDPGGYEAILKRHGAEQAARDEKIALLNKALTEQTDTVGQSLPGLGVGYYSRELDAILTYGPSSSFGQVVGLSIPEKHPGREVMSGNKILVQSGTMVRGDIMNAMIPVERDGHVIGYIWANELMTDITRQVDRVTRNILLAMLGCLLLTAALLTIVARRAMSNVSLIIQGVRAMRGDLSARIPPCGGELGEVAENINAMAEDIGRANEESNRAVSALQSVMSNVDATIFVCDPRSSEVVYANKQLLDLLGEKDITGRKCHEAVQGRPEPCRVCPRERLLSKEGGAHGISLQREEHNARLGRDYLITDRLITWHDGRLLQMEVGTDITERNALAVAEATNLAQRDFLARMSHEIRTPMNGVLGMTRLAMQADPAPTQMAYLKKIQSSAALLLGIINDILDFSRIEAGKLAIETHRFSMGDMLENIRELILPRVSENEVDLIFNIDPSVPEWAVGDGLRLSQVLLNLLGNASKFTLEGFVALDVRARSLENGSLRLDCEVRDSGIGMSDEEVASLFRPFTQADASTSRKFGGTGLGLSISKALVELMGGAISVTSARGIGSTFSFHIELLPSEGEDDAAEIARPWEKLRYEGCRFLLVEDNAVNQEIAVAILGELGAAVDVAEDGEQGLRAYLNKDYDLIFMDVRMPVMDGLEATRRIRSSVKRDAGSVPIVAMTANAMQEDRQASREAGMNAHIAKPIDMDELQKVLYDTLKRPDWGR
ncbi:response regulator, partial [Desulfovibrio sp. OttesenSCG-928-G11]|nr:response regulator [Desulfovibrio sp. OttesenSCG-928-G11]